MYNLDTILDIDKETKQRVFLYATFEEGGEGESRESEEKQETKLTADFYIQLINIPDRSVCLSIYNVDGWLERCIGSKDVWEKWFIDIYM